MSGPTPYFHQRAMGGAGPTPQTGLRTQQPAIRSMVPDTGIGIGSHPFGSSFHMEPTPRPVMMAHGDGSTDGGSRESEKKKRGRPRKYGPDGSGGAAPSPQGRIVTPGSGSGSASGSGWSLTDPSQKRGRGRPPGSGKIQRLALLGELLYNSYIFFCLVGC